MKKIKKKYDHILEKLIDNPEDISICQAYAPLGKTMGIQSTILPSYEYVIITSAALKTDFEALVSWKTRKGINTGIVTVEQILANYTTDNISGITDNAGAIRQYLADSYNDGNPKTVYALLGGDYSVVPIRYGCGFYTTDSWHSNPSDPTFDYQIPADLYFSDFTGDWKVDTDDFFGQGSDDAPDYNPEIFVGRLLCSSSQDVKNWIEKLIKYEQNPGNGDLSYLIQSFMIVSDQMQHSYFPNQAVQVSQELPSSFNHEIWEEEPSGDAPNPTAPLAHDVIVEMNNHYGLYSWFGHGSPVSITTKSHLFNKSPWWCINTVDNIGETPDETEDALENLTNFNHPSILYSIGCDNTPFDDYDPKGWFPGRNLGEGFTVLTKAGGPSFLGNTRYGWIGSSYLLYKKFADLVAGGTCHLGEAELISKSQNTSSKHYLAYSHNLIGCPETEIWTATPSQFTNINITDNGSSIIINSGVSECDICLCSGNTDYHVIESDVQQVTFNNITDDDRPLYITITKNNYIPYTAITGGTFTSDEIWFGNLHTLGSVVIDGNSTLTILPNTYIKFGGYYNLMVRDGSRILAQGTEKNPVHFTSNTHTRQAWKNCYIYSSNNKFEHCIFEYGNWALNFYGNPGFASNNIVRNCIFRNNDQALRIEKNNVAIDYCEILDNRHGLITINNTYISIYYNKIYNNERDGIYSTSGNYLNLESNLIQNNGIGSSSSRHGIYSRNGDYIDIYSFNTIKENYQYEVYGSYGNPYINCYYNSIHDNSGYEIYNYSGNYETIYATYCWHGEYPPNSSQFYGNVQWLIPLRNKPSWEGGLSKQIAKPKDPQKTVANLKKIIETNPTSIDAEQAIIELHAIIRQDYLKNLLCEKSTYYTYLDKIHKQYKETKLAKLALRNMILWKMLDNDAQKAISLCKKGLTELSDIDRMCALESLIRLSLYENQIDQAVSYFNEYSQKYSFNNECITMLTESITDAISLMENSHHQEKIHEGKQAIIENEIILVQNYPNPGNPTTTISYNLPESSMVRMRVFDLLGREVYTLINEFQDSGTHEVIWHGINNNGNCVSSGIYIYMIETNKRTITKKLMLLK